MTAHTPGPWLQEGLTVYALHHIGAYRNGLPVLVNRFSAHIDPCTHQGGTELEAGANARLIAAAPDLLAAAELTLRQLKQTDPTSWTEAQWEVHETVVAAIAKARGAA